jgi:hypothetical protein
MHTNTTTITTAATTNNKRIVSVINAQKATLHYFRVLMFIVMPLLAAFFLSLLFKK